MWGNVGVRAIDLFLENRRTFKMIIQSLYDGKKIVFEIKRIFEKK